MRQLLKLPAAAELSTQQAAQVLQAAAPHGTGTCMEQLCKLPAAGQLGSAQLLQALEAALARGHAACVRQLTQLPAAKQLSSKALAGLLQTAQQHVRSTGYATCFAALRKLMAAARKAQQVEG
jgi:hypothetical protein